MLMNTVSLPVVSFVAEVVMLPTGMKNLNYFSCKCERGLIVKANILLHSGALSLASSSVLDAQMLDD
jgi:hypothetical protein